MRIGERYIRSDLPLKFFTYINAKLREDRKAELERHVQEVNSLLRLSNADSGRSADLGEGAPETESIEWKGIPEAAPKSSMDEYEAEYIEEDKHTSVTVEELAGSREGSLQADEDTSEASNRQRAINGPSTYQENAQVKKRLTGISGPVKAKRKKFRYESKTERKMSRLKVKAKNSKHAKARKSG